MPKLCVVRVRGSVHIKHDIKKTFDLLNLKKKNHCTIIPDSPQYKGMLEKLERFATWGELSDETENLLVKSKGKADVFKLNPPRKGYGRKGVKLPFKLRGALGYRADKINDLIKRML